MTSERAAAYGKVMRIVRGACGDGLMAGEVQRIRDAADELFFARCAEDDLRGSLALDDVIDLADDLVETDRWDSDPAELLVIYVAACGGVDAASFREVWQPGGLPALS